MLANRRNLIVAALGSLAVCSVAQANSLAPYVLFWPGVLHISLIYSLPATVLVAIVERDFVRRQGEQRGSLVLSLRANLLSTLVGALLIPASSIAVYSVFGLAWPGLCVAISWGVEIGYLKRCVDRSFSATRLLIGNAISAALLACIPLIAMAVKDAKPEWVWKMHAILPQTSVVAAVVSLAVLIAAWFVPAKRREQTESDERAAVPDAAAAERNDARELVETPQLASSK